MPKDDIDEYFLLIEKLEEIIWALEGSCNDIDCDKYTYKNLLRKKYKPVLEHNFSCMPKLRREKEAAMHLLSLNKFRKFRYKKCGICSDWQTSRRKRAKNATFPLSDSQ